MLLVALLPLLALGNSETRQKDQEEKELKVHQEDDFRAPDFDLSQLNVGGIKLSDIFWFVKGAILGDCRGAWMSLSRGTPTSDHLRVSTAIIWLQFFSSTQVSL